MSTLSPNLSASGREGPEGESQIYIVAETGLLVKILPHENRCDILWNTDTSLMDLLHTIHAEEWHTEGVDISRFDVTRIGHRHTRNIQVPETLAMAGVPDRITTLRDLRKLILYSDRDVRSILQTDPVEFSEDIAGTSIYWASESIPDVQDDYPNRIRVKLSLPLSDQSINLLDWYYSNFAPHPIRQDYERGGDPIQKITSAIRSY